MERNWMGKQKRIRILVGNTTDNRVQDETVFVRGIFSKMVLRI